MLAAVLHSQGYKTGLYTSPHLVDFRERMRINGKMIPTEKVIEFVEKWQATDYDGHPSFFELTMMMAFDWFAKEKVDYAIIEVGMGGRLDSTNIISPEVCVITNISNDHTQFLGDTLTKIATEKAGIIKRAIPVVIGEAEGEIREVFESKAREVDAPIIFAEERSRLSAISADTVKGGWRCLIKEGEVRVPLGGDYQKKNINTVLHAVDAMREAGIKIDNESVLNGLGHVDSLTGFKGRWTKLSDNPLVIADTGHNIAGITYNISQLRRLLAERKGGRLRIVIGFVADKTIDKILKLLPADADYYLTNAQIPRALPVDQLKERFEAAGLTGSSYPNVKEAYSAAIRDAIPEDIVFVGGSTFIVADLLA